MSGRRHHRGRPRPPRRLVWVTCTDCGKHGYRTRDDARAAARTIDRTMRTYACGPLWHVGHRSKTKTRDDYRRDGRATGNI